MLRIIVVRHGETDHNKNNILQGHLDIPLNETGVKQAEQLGTWLSQRYTIDHIYSSPLARALKTAELVAEKQPARLTLLPGLMEINVGTWQGLTSEQCKLADPELCQQLREDGLHTRRPQGESYWDLYQRTSAALEHVVKEHTRGTIALFTHGGCVRTIIAHAMSAPPELFAFNSALMVGNTSFSLLEYLHGSRRWQVRTVNSTCHLHH
ncbi:MAG: histidine phosphatase family protein [Firmicutes bacterium]|nr:histidine phosphatase family protein [Dethiobacter sp.]MBS3887941.1 histidine phosphatase family protein [Bacillota bacterium]MBS4054219.1 histidine phosphatase family protein [Thermaerobacter sp.]